MTVDIFDSLLFSNIVDIFDSLLFSNIVDIGFYSLLYRRL